MTHAGSRTSAHANVRTSPMATRARLPDPRARSTATRRTSRTWSRRAELRPRRASGVVHLAMQSTPSRPRLIARKRQVRSTTRPKARAPDASGCPAPLRPALHAPRRRRRVTRIDGRSTREADRPDPDGPIVPVGRTPVRGRAPGAGGLRELQGARRDARRGTPKRRRHGTEGQIHHALPRDVRGRGSARPAPTSYGGVSAAGRGRRRAARTRGRATGSRTVGRCSRRRRRIFP